MSLMSPGSEQGIRIRVKPSEIHKGKRTNWMAEETGKWISEETERIEAKMETLKNAGKRERQTDSEKGRVNWLLCVTWQQSLIGQSANPRLSLPFSLTHESTWTDTHTHTHFFWHNTCHHYHLFIFSLHFWHLLLWKTSDSREMTKRVKRRCMERQ